MSRLGIRVYWQERESGLREVVLRSLSYQSRRRCPRYNSGYFQNQSHRRRDRSRSKNRWRLRGWRQERAQPLREFVLRGLQDQSRRRCRRYKSGCFQSQSHRRQGRSRWKHKCRKLIRVSRTAVLRPAQAFVLSLALLSRSLPLAVLPLMALPLEDLPSMVPLAGELPSDWKFQSDSSPQGTADRGSRLLLFQSICYQ